MDIIKVLEGRQEYLKALARKEQMQNGDIPERVAQARLSEVSALLYVLKVETPTQMLQEGD